jgi:hypothetical protein
LLRRPRKKVAKKKTAAPAPKQARTPKPIVNGNPFPGGVISQAFEMARKGTTRKALEALCEKNDIGSARVMWVIRKEEHKGIKWTATVDKETGAVKIVVKQSGKKVA